MQRPPPQREHGLDALRAAATLLVLFHHTAITYGAIGGWFYREVPTDTHLDTTLLVFFCAFNQAFFMGLFFLLAGYFTPGAIARRGPAAFARERLLRLGLPLLTFWIVIGPATIALADTADGAPFLPTLLHLWRTHHFEVGPLWFAEALLIFAAAALAWHALVRRSPPPRPFPSTLRLALAALLTGLAAFALRLLWPLGDAVASLQLGYFASYIVLFAAGYAGAASSWLSAVPARQARIWGSVAWCAGPVLPALFLLAPHIPALAGNFAGGWNLPALVYACWEPLVAWGIILALLRSFTRRCQTLGPIWTNLTRRAYAIYVIHPPVLVGISLAWRTVAAPHLAKFVVTGTATCGACYLIAGALLRIPPLRRVL
jgi:peptidoglycan/LPS O-acetylase OafA/YrhL